jgi:hypothetical protein
MVCCETWGATTEEVCWVMVTFEEFKCVCLLRSEQTEMRLTTKHENVSESCQRWEWGLKGLLHLLECSELKDKTMVSKAKYSFQMFRL